MLPRLIFVLLFITATVCAVAQPEKTGVQKELPVFERIMGEMKNYKIDSSRPPDDKFTRKIMELRDLKGGFNIHEAISFKLADDRNNNKITGEEWKKYTEFYSSGRGKELLDNTINWIYRDAFTYGEMKELVKFYRSPAGQKMAEKFPVIMLKSFAASEMIHKQLTGNK